MKSRKPSSLRITLDQDVENEKVGAQANWVPSKVDENVVTATVTREGQRAWIHLPKTIFNDNNDDPKTKKYPLLIVLHGAGKDKFWKLKEQMHEFASVAKDYNIIVIYPEAKGSTWDYIRSSADGSSGNRHDIEFIEYVMNTTRKILPVDDTRIAMKGISDGGSMALSLTTYNSHIFQACLSVSAGFCVLEESSSKSQSKEQQDDDTVKLFLQHGEQDKMFPLERVGKGLQNKLVQAGYPVEFRIATQEGHVPSDWRTSFITEWLEM